MAKLAALGSALGEVLGRNLITGEGSLSQIPGLGLGDEGMDEDSDESEETELKELEPNYTGPEKYIVPVVFLIVFILGLLGNGTLIRIFAKHRHMRSVPNMYICNLAVAHLLVIIFGIPFNSTYFTLDSWPYGRWACKISEYIPEVGTSVSAFTLAILSGHCYFAIMNPMQKLRGRRVTISTCFFILGIWTSALIFALPTLLFYSAHVHEDNDEEVTYCYAEAPDFLSHAYDSMATTGLFLAYYALPLGIIACFYIRMARRLVLPVNTLASAAFSQTLETEERKKTAKLALFLVAVFCLCFLPNHIILLWLNWYPNPDNDVAVLRHRFYALGFCLDSFGLCANPILLYFISATYRERFKKYLCFCTSRDDAKPNTSEIRGRFQGVGDTGKYYPLVEYIPKESEQLRIDAWAAAPVLEQDISVSITFQNEIRSDGGHTLSNCNGK